MPFNRCINYRSYATYVSQYRDHNEIYGPEKSANSEPHIHSMIWGLITGLIHEVLIIKYNRDFF